VANLLLCDTKHFVAVKIALNNPTESKNVVRRTFPAARFLGVKPDNHIQNIGQVEMAFTATLLVYSSTCIEHN